MNNLLVIFLVILMVFCETECGCPKIKTKKKWDGTAPTNIDYQLIPVDYVIIHHTASTECTTYSQCSTQLKSIQSYHMNALGWSDIGYNFLIGGDGNIYEGAGWHKIGAHTIGYNSKSIGIAFIGNFGDILPTNQSIEITKELLKCGIDKGELAKRYKLFGARQLLSTESPGLTLYNEIQEWDHWSSYIH